MTLTSFTALAATCNVNLGTAETVENGLVRIRSRIFTDEVESGDSRIAGTNTPTLDIDLDPQSGAGELTARAL